MVERQAGIHQISNFRSRQNAWFTEIFPDNNCRDRRLRRDNLFRNQRQFYGPLMMSRLPIIDKIALLGSMTIDIFKQLTSPNSVAYGSVNSSRCIDRCCNFYIKE